MYLFFPCTFLSMIFGFLGKFRIDIEKNPSTNKTFQDQKMLSKKSGIYFSRPNNFREKSMKKSMKNENFKISIFFENFSKFRIFHFSLTFSSIFSPKICWSRKIFFRLFRHLFLSWKCLRFYGFFSISIRNFPKNPKIILSKSHGKDKYMQNKKVRFCLY